ncbi:MAG: LytR/AlgR family response regulator transcription factor [[Clostridium] scindens]
MYRVAVCDDNREILNEIGRMLEDTTEEISDVDLYASAQELENIYTEHGQYDIILMDILLEQENGISLARRIQDQYPDTQVIFFTGYLEQAGISLEPIRPLFWSSLLVRISWMPLWARQSGN